MTAGCISITPNIYARVSKYIPWINQNLDEFVDKHIKIKSFQESHKNIPQPNSEASQIMAYSPWIISVVLAIFLINAQMKLSKLENHLRSTARFKFDKEV